MMGVNKQQADWVSKSKKMNGSISSSIFGLAKPASSGSPQTRFHPVQWEISVMIIDPVLAVSFASESEGVILGMGPVRVMRFASAKRARSVTLAAKRDFAPRACSA